MKINVYRAFIFVIISTNVAHIKSPQCMELFKKLWGEQPPNRPINEQSPIIQENPEKDFKIIRKANKRYFKAINFYKNGDYDLAISKLNMGHLHKERLASLALAELHLFGLSPSSEVTFAALSPKFPKKKAPQQFFIQNSEGEDGISTTLAFMNLNTIKPSFYKSIPINCQKGFDILKMLAKEEDFYEAKLIFDKLKLVTPKEEKHKPSESMPQYSDPIKNCIATYPKAELYRSIIMFTLDYVDTCSKKQILNAELKDYHLYEVNPDYALALQHFDIVPGLGKKDFSAGIRMMAKAIQERFPPAVLLSKRLSKDYFNFIKDVEENSSFSFAASKNKKKSSNEEIHTAKLNISDELKLGKEGFFKKYLYEIFALKMKENKFTPLHLKLIEHTIHNRLGSILTALNNQFILVKKEGLSVNLEDIYKNIKENFVGAQWGLDKVEDQKESIVVYSIFQNCIVRDPTIEFEINRVWSVIFEGDDE